MSAPSIVTPENLQTISWQNLQVGKLIGQGGYSEVYRGNWNGKEVAIKQLLLKKLPDDLIKDFENETKVMAECSKCAQIVKLLGVCLEEGHYAMVMSYMEKGSLYQTLRDAKIDLAWQPLRLHIAIDIGEGLSYLHDREILHRDLKSLNILLDNNFNAKITDFGLSKIKLETKSTSTLHKQSAGTVRWKAPELFKRNAQHSKASDVYSFGMILWEIASRKLPFSDADDDVTVMGWIKDGEQEKIPSDCPPEYSKLISQAWAKEPDKRPSAQYIVLQLEKLLPRPQAKSWHIDPDTKGLGEGIGKEYALIDATAKDIDKVRQFYLHHPMPGYEIASIKVVYNPTFNRSFESHMKKLQKRHGNSFFDPKWSMNLLDKQLDWRQKVDEIFEQMAKPYTDPDYPNVKLLPLWHGTNGKAIESICQVGYANPTAIDAGFFGRGLYGAHEAAYPYRVYCKGAFFLNWVAIYSAYPVVLGDESKLEAKGNFENYDAHFIPVSPRDPGNPRESNYDPCQPFTPHTYTELVVFESAACLPRYLVELQPILTKPLSVSSASQLTPKKRELPPDPNLLLRPSLKAPTPVVKVESKVPAMAFGKAAWEQYIGDIGIEPPLPTDIDKILQSPCPFWAGKKVHETHLLTLIPKTVNGKPLTLISLGELVEAPKQGNVAKYSLVNSDVKKEHGNTPIQTSYWVLMTRDVIEGSRSKTPDDQCKLLESKAKSTGLPYTVPRAIEATVSILMHFVRTKEYLYTDNQTGKQYTYTRCLEKVDNNKRPVAIGGFGWAGLHFGHYSHWDNDGNGVGGTRKLMAIETNPPIKTFNNDLFSYPSAPSIAPVSSSFTPSFIHQTPKVEKKEIKPVSPQAPTIAQVPAIVIANSVSRIPPVAFGKAAWEQFIGDVGVEPPLPPDIDKILQSQCPFWPGKKVQDTHLLTLIPKTVNGKPLTLISLEELVKAPKQGNATQYRYFEDLVKKELGNTPIQTSYWVLMTRDVLEGSRNKSYEDQSKHVAKKAKKTGLPYILPKAIEAAATILMHYVRTKEYLYTDNKTGKQYNWTRCIEKVDNNKWPVALGGFGFSGLQVYTLLHEQSIVNSIRIGVASARKF